MEMTNDFLAGEEEMRLYMKQCKGRTIVSFLFVTTYFIYEILFITTFNILQTDPLVHKIKLEFFVWKIL